ncbi:nucleotidyltransferase domain-containing protein [Actinoplanes siamensis]|uniref:Polymerase nucleotidyl transferase domain-containing protein n=1 Tax=Actinoplanes siamensis TaxID=1223317 RepID=A0A919NBE3_9ACTN|nr:nucleotidyltransferase domain-containing protein [Actinoplanes siamensis]GIF07833.1 hypothetical protein Asi03nite_53710 [Actinoplanes siamensis]
MVEAGAAGRRAAGEAAGVIARLAARHFGEEAAEVTARDMVRAAAGEVRQIPQGFTERQFGRFARGARQLRKQSGLPEGDLVVQGSRVRGTARSTSDIDVALRLDERSFFEHAELMLGRAPIGTRLRKSMLRDIRQNGQLRSFTLGHEFQVLRRRLLDSESPFEVQFSAIRIGGRLDTGPFIPLG